MGDDIVDPSQSIRMILSSKSRLSPAPEARGESSAVSVEADPEVKSLDSSSSNTSKSNLDDVSNVLQSHLTVSSTKGEDKWRNKASKIGGQGCMTLPEDLKDYDLIQKQHAIMQQIMEDQQASTKNLPSKVYKSGLISRDSSASSSCSFYSARCSSPEGSSSSSSGDLTMIQQFLTDPQVMEEQQRILDAIRREQTRTEQTTRSSRVSSSTADNQVTKLGESPRHANKEPKIADAAHEDRLYTVYNNKKLRVKGTRHTWNDIAKGQATLVQCPTCRTILQVAASAKLLYCTQCGDVSPVAITDCVAGSDDEKIATVVQRQELGVALAKKCLAAASNVESANDKQNGI